MTTHPTWSETSVFDLNPGALPDGLRAYMEEPAPPVSTPAAAASCCSTAAQETCCEPPDKDACCGPEATADGGCGCQ